MIETKIEYKSGAWFKVRTATTDEILPELKYTFSQLPNRNDLDDNHRLHGFFGGSFKPVKINFAVNGRSKIEDKENLRNTIADECIKLAKRYIPAFVEHEG